MKFFDFGGKFMANMSLIESVELIEDVLIISFNHKDIKQTYNSVEDAKEVYEALLKYATDK